MNVLSLFDGLSGGRIALERIGLPVTKYYASEIDKHAITVSQANYPDIIRLGDVTKWRDWDIETPDLIIAGSPCQGFSFAGKQLNFNDPRSSLFFEFVDILHHYQEINPDVKFMLENVNMKKKYLDVITRLLGVEPIKINSALVSAQNRVRWYWTNIDNVMLPENKEVLAKEFNGKVLDTKRKLKRSFTRKHANGFLDLRGYYGNNSTSQRVYGLNSKLPTLLTNNTGGNNPLWITTDNTTAYRASIDLCCFLQTIPNGYTKTVPINQQYKMIGNGWTIDVISHIFKNLNHRNLSEIFT